MLHDNIIVEIAVFHYTDLTLISRKKFDWSCIHFCSISLWKCSHTHILSDSRISVLLKVYSDVPIPGTEALFFLWSNECSNIRPHNFNISIDFHPVSVKFVEDPWYEMFTMFDSGTSDIGSTVELFKYHLQADKCFLVGISWVYQDLTAQNLQANEHNQPSDPNCAPKCTGKSIFIPKTKMSNVYKLQRVTVFIQVF